MLFGAFAGVLVDRFDKRRLMVLVDLVRAGLVLLVPVAAERSLLLVYAISFATASAGVFFDPAKLAIVPEIVPPGRLLRANSLLATGENLTEMLGWAFAGVLLASVETRVAFGLDAATFVVSALALALMRRPRGAHAEARGPSRSFGHQLREGLGYLRGHRGLRANTLMAVVCAAGLGAAYPLTFLLAVDVLGGGTRAFGALEAAVGAGYLAGSLLLAGLATRVRKGTTMIAGLALMGGCLVGVAFAGSVRLACVPYVVFGAANAAALVAIDTYLQTAVPEGLRGRVLGARFTLTQGTYALSVLAGGALAGVFDVRTLFVAAAAVVTLSALVGLASREVRRA